MNANLLTSGPPNKLLLCLAITFWISSANAASFEPLSNIRAAAEEFALAQLDDEKLSDIKARASRMDPRLQMVKCEHPLEAFSTANSRNIARTTIGVRCNGSKPWTLYVPVSISALTAVVYSSRALLRGEILQVEDLDIKQLPLHQLPANYFRSIDRLAGMEVSRSLNSGAIFTINTVKIRKLVQQGQEVMILASGGGVEVRMSGIALKSGAKGELIPIRNLSSGRIIEAMVLQDGTVVVNR
ncbi:MAG: flagellar basal body P-ring formation protein FlgA [Proteobacteria bacterium]|nr:flagellar basal body P-ring formation protein FlgA [Pseudomonadota bacterium]